MGYPTTPQDAAPSYDDAIHSHPLNQFTPSASSSGYSTVPQLDIENDAPAHNHSSASPAPESQNESIVQTIAGVFRPKPHSHCEACDKQLELREVRRNEKHCCTMVALTFIIVAICMMILGVVIVDSRSKRHHD